jgi:hypothetical protein
MPLYTFTVSGDGYSTAADLRDDNAAWMEAIRLAGAVIRDVKGDLASNTEWHVTNESRGEAVATVSVRAQRHLPLG